MTQNKEIIRYLTKGNKLSPLEALERFGCFRLSARILDLRKLGFDIKTEYVTKGKKTYAEYSLSGAADAGTALRSIGLDT